MNRKLLSTALLLLVASCKQPSNPATRPAVVPAPTTCPSVSSGAPPQVPIRIIRSLHQPSVEGAVRDQPDGSLNVGCRLKRKDINEYVNQAVSVFQNSLNITLVPEWINNDPKQGVIIHDFFFDLTKGIAPLGTPPRTVRALYPLFMLYEVHAAAHTQDSFFPNTTVLDPNKLNIFFTGNIKVPNCLEPGCGVTSVLANTVDPFSEANDFNAGVPFTAGMQHPDQTTFNGQQWFPHAHIYINDRGGNTGAPVWNPNDHVLEHELCHFFLRQTSGQGGRYNAQEHLPCGGANPCTIPYIMKDKVPHPIKFYDNPPICESQEIWTKAANPFTP